ncbi:unnamed protein product [Amaranthus hypochondriacus]
MGMEALHSLRHNIWELRRKLRENKGIISSNWLEGNKDMENRFLLLLDLLQRNFAVVVVALHLVEETMLNTEFDERVKDVLPQIQSFLSGGQGAGDTEIHIEKSEVKTQDILERLSTLVMMPIEECVIGDQNSILKELFKLHYSYEQLPQEIQQFLQYCSLFPKNYELNKTYLTHLWASQEHMSNEEVGKQEEISIVDVYIRELLKNGYLLESTRTNGTRDILHYKMHNLVYEFIKIVSKPELYLVDETNVDEIHGVDILHSCFIVDYSWDKAPSWLLNDAKNLQSLIFLPRRLYDYADIRELHEIFLRLRWLRVLDLVAVNCIDLPNSLGDLKDIRYLRLGVSSEVLPTSVCRLVNLQTLDLRHSCVTKLTQDFCNLSSLRFLFTGDKLIDIPFNFGKLTYLQMLDVFIIGENNELDALDSLKNLVGKLTIRHEKHHEKDEFKKVIRVLEDNTQLTHIALIWSTSYASAAATSTTGVASIEFNCLTLPRHLKSLEVYRWKGALFPHQSMDRLKNLTSIHIQDCSECKDLTQLKTLPCLKSLQIWDLNVLEYIDDTSHDLHSCAIQFFPSLESLILVNLPKLKGYTSTMMESSHPQPQVKTLPSLIRLTLSHCSKMISMPLCDSLESLMAQNIQHKLLKQFMLSPKLRKLEIVSINQLDSTLNVRGLYHLESLTIRRCPQLQTLSLRYYHTSLQRLEIHECEGLVHIKTDRLNNLSTLEIKRCSNLTWEPQDSTRIWEGIKSLKLINTSFNLDSLHLCFPNLNTLSLHSFYTLRNLPISIGKLTQLEWLAFRNFPLLTTLPKSLGNLSIIKRIDIQSCPRLQQIPKSFAQLKSLHLVIQSNMLDLVEKQCPQILPRCYNLDGQDFPPKQHVFS